ncbi:MAG: hypothetical protein ACK491_06745 [Pseudanabaena sp.]|jgi:hypothetical protein
MAELRSAIFWVLCPKQSLHCYSKAVSLFQQEAFFIGQIEHAGILKIETYVHHNLENGTMLHGIVMQK